MILAQQAEELTSCCVVPMKKAESGSNFLF